MKVVKEGNTVVCHIHIDDLSTTSVGDIEDCIFDKNQIDHEVVLFVGANVLDSSCLLAHYADAIAAACYMIRAVVVHLPRGGSPMMLWEDVPHGSWPSVRDHNLMLRDATKDLKL